jgi:hypothetical protein
MYKAATARTRIALDGFSAGEITIQNDGIHFPLTVSDANGKIVASHPFVLRPSGECTGISYDEDGNVVVGAAINPDAAVGALEMILGAYAKAAGESGRVGSIGDELLGYLVTIGLLPR